MLRAAFASIVLLTALAPAQQIVGTYRSNDLDGLRQAVQADSANAGLRLRLAQALLRTGKETAHPDAASARLKEAEAEFDRILELVPEARIPLRVRAFDGYQTRRFERTISFGKRLLARAPADSEISRYVLKALVLKGKKDEAVSFLVEWLERGTTPSLGVLQGSLYSLTLNPEFRQKLEAALDAAIARRPRDAQLLLYKTIVLAETGRNEAAWRVMHDAEALGLCDARTGQRHAFARTLSTKTVEHGANPVSYMGSDLVEIDKALGRVPDHVGLRMRRARVLDLKGEVQASLMGYASALEQNPDLWPALIRRGELLIKAGRAAEAVKPLRHARELYPEISIGRLLEIEALVKAGRTEESVARITNEANRGEPVQRLIDAIELVAKGGAMADQLEAALRRAMGEHSKNPYLPAHLALLARARGKKDQARQLALQAEKLGLAGPNAFPHRVLYWAFEEPIPEAVSKPQSQPRR